MEFALAYIDNDSVPELIVRSRESISSYDQSIRVTLCGVFTWKSGKVYRTGYSSTNSNLKNEPLFIGYYEKKGVYLMRTAPWWGTCDDYMMLSGNKATRKIGKEVWEIDGGGTVYELGVRTATSEPTSISKATFEKELNKLTGGAKIKSAVFRKNTKANRTAYLK